MNRFSGMGPGLAAAIALICSPASAQSIHPLWLGTWQVTQSSLTRSPPTLQISRRAEAVEVRLDGKVCSLAYDGQVQASWITQQMQERRDVQLDWQNWTGVTKEEAASAQLVGLRREFEQALQIVAGIPSGNFRRVRFKGTDCASEDDVFYLLSGAGRSHQRLYRISLPRNSVGVEATLHTLVP
jgi:hypothetical protein